MKPTQTLQAATGDEPVQLLDALNNDERTSP